MIRVSMPGLDTHRIEFILAVQKSLDESLLKVGFSRSESSKGGKEVTFTYRQIAIIT